MDGFDDLAAVDALEVNACDAEVGMPELALDHDQRDALVRHLDRVGVPQLVRREGPSDARGASRMVQLLARGRSARGAGGRRPARQQFA